MLLKHCFALIPTWSPVAVKDMIFKYRFIGLYFIKMRNIHTSQLKFNCFVRSINNNNIYLAYE